MKAVPGGHGDGRAAQNQDDVHHQHQHAEDDTELLADDGEDAVCKIHGDHPGRTQSQPYAEQAAGGDRHQHLHDLVAGGLIIHPRVLPDGDPLFHMGEHLVAQHRGPRRAQQSHAGHQQVAGIGIVHEQRREIIDQRRAQVLLQHQHAQTVQAERQPRDQPPVAHEIAQDQQKRQLDHLAGLQAHAAHPDPVGRAVLLRTDSQRQGQQQHRAAHHHIDQERPAPHVAHQHDAPQHNHDAHAVVHGLLHSAGRSAVQIGGIENQYAQCAQEISDGQQQLIRREEAGQPHGSHVDQRRNDHAQGKALPCDLAL